MCGAVGGILQGGIGAMSAIAGYNAKVEDFNAREAMWKKNYVNSLAAGRDEEAQLSERAIQEQAATGQKMQEYNVEGAVRAAAAETSAAGAGVGGISAQDIVRNMVGAAGRNRATAKMNADYTAAQLAAEQRATVTTEENRINSVQRPTAPNPGEAILGVAGALIGGIGGAM